MIRATTTADDAALIAMGRKFYDTLPYKDVPYDESSAARWLAIMRERGALLIVDIDGQAVGMAGALFAPFIFSDRYTVGSEVMYWVDPECRSYGIGRELLAELELCAKNAGCIRFTMISVSDHEKLRMIYGSAGYTEAERSYVKKP